MVKQRPVVHELLNLNILVVQEYYPPMPALRLNLFGGHFEPLTHNEVVSFELGMSLY